MVAVGAFILYRAYRYFPAAAIHLAVVDPGNEARVLYFSLDDVVVSEPDCRLRLGDLTPIFHLSQ